MPSERWGQRGRNISKCHYQKRRKTTFMSFPSFQQHCCDTAQLTLEHNFVCMNFSSLLINILMNESNFFQKRQTQKSMPNATVSLTQEFLYSTTMKLTHMWVWMAINKIDISQEESCSRCEAMWKLLLYHIIPSHSHFSFTKWANAIQLWYSNKIRYSYIKFLDYKSPYKQLT